ADSKHKENNLLLYKELYKYISEAYKLQYYIIVMGDFNIKPDKLILNAPRNQKKKNIPKWRRSVFAYLKKHNFSDAANYLSHTPETTWSNQKAQSRIDLMWISSNFIQ